MVRFFQLILLCTLLPAVLQAELIAHYDFSDGDLLDNEVGSGYTLRAMKSVDASLEKVSLNRLEGTAVFPGGGSLAPWLQAEGPGALENFTVSFWFRTDQVHQWASYAGLFSSDTDVGAGSWMVFSGESAGGAVTLLRGEYPEPHQPGVWQHVVVQRTGGGQPRVEMTIRPLGGVPGEPVVSYEYNGTLKKIVLGNNHRLQRGYRMEMANVKIFDDAKVSADTLFGEGPGTHTLDPVPMVSIKKSLRLLEREATLLRDELKMLPQFSDSMPLNAFGYHSDYLPALDALPEQPRWTVEIEGVGGIEDIYLVPAADRRVPGMPGYGFPKRFRLIAIADDGQVRVFADWRERDYPDPGRFPIRIAAPGGHQKKIILEVYRGVVESGREFFALDEVWFRADHFVYKKEGFKASGSFESRPFWSVDYLGDERTSLGLPVLPAADGAPARQDFSLKFPSVYDSRVAIDFDLGENRQINVVSLFPAHAPEGIMVPGYGFPETVELQMHAETADGGRELVRVAEMNQLTNPGNNTVRLMGNSKQARWLRLVFERYPEYKGRSVFAMGEIDVFGIFESLGRNAEVGMTLLSESQKVGDLDALTDGRADGVKVLPLIHWLDGLDRSRRLALRLDQVEALQAGLQQRRARFWTRVRIVGLSVLGGTLLAVAGGALALRRRHARKMDLRIEQEHRQTELEQMKIRFFTHISHELRSPLTLILGPVEKLLGELQKDEHKNLLGLAHKNVRKLQVLVDQLLDFRKLQDGRMGLEWKSVNLARFVRNGFEVYQSMATDKNISYRLDCLDSVGRVVVDSGKFQAIMDNLIANALKYTPEQGRVAVSLAVEEGVTRGRRIEGGGQWIEFSVEDTGVGIAAADLPYVFEQYFRADGLEAIQAKGSGIGLSYVKGLVDLWGGEIEVASPVANGKGTRFTVKLPVGEQGAESMAQSGEHPADQADLSDLMPHAPGSTPESAPLVLLVEDSEDIRAFVRAELEGDYRILEAENGRVGLELATEHQPDLVLSDVMMPEMDGIEMCRKLKRDEQTSHLPVILLTARGSQEHQLEGLQTGADDYVSKPFSMPILLARIHNLLAARRNLRERFSREIITVEPVEITVNPVDQEFLQRAIGVVEDHMDDVEFSVKALASELHMADRTLRRKLSAMVDQSPTEFIRILRLKRAAQLLRDSGENISDIAAQVGFMEPTHFSRGFKSQFGMSPTEFRKNGVARQ